MASHKTKLLIWFIALATVMACVIPSIPSAVAPLPTLDPGAINTLVAQTANAASTQTAAALPTSTATVTFTPTPRSTNTPEPTPTNTFIFILSSPTPIVLPTLTGGTISDKNYACQITSVSPANGFTISPRKDFDGKWTVKNIGLRQWEGSSTDYIYLSGTKFHKVSGYDLAKTVKVGGTTNIIVDMEAPKNPGAYTTTWTLRVGSENFCPMSLTIVVK